MVCLVACWLLGGDFRGCFGVCLVVVVECSGVVACLFCGLGFLGGLGVWLVVCRLVWWGGLPGGACLGLVCVGLVGMVGVVLLLALRWRVSSLWVGGLFGCLLLG